MATLQDAYLAYQSMLALAHVRRDLRAEAQVAKDRYNAGSVAEAVATAQNSGTNLFATLSRIASHQEAAEAALLNVYGVSATAVRSAYTTLKTNAEAMRDVQPDGSDLVTVMDDILATVPAEVRLW